MLIIKENYADERRTEIRHAEGEIDMRDLIEDEEIAITLTHFGYIKRLPADTYKSQKEVVEEYLLLPQEKKIS